MNIFKKIFGHADKKKEEIISFPNDAHNMWEDDYLMIEFLPKENLAFIQTETKRIDERAQNSFNGHGFTSITPIGEKDVKMIDKAYDFETAVKLLSLSGLSRINSFIYQGATLLTGDDKPVGFGNKHFAIILEENKGILKNIWLNGRPKTDEERDQLVTTTLTVGQEYDFVLVNWFNSTYCDTADRDSVQDFIKNCC